jgi:hypothetical protein
MLYQVSEKCVFQSSNGIIQIDKNDTFKLIPWKEQLETKKKSNSTKKEENRVFNRSSLHIEESERVVTFLFRQSLEDVLISFYHV